MISCTFHGRDICFSDHKIKLTRYQLRRRLAFLASYLLQSCCNAFNKVWKKWTQWTFTPPYVAIEGT
jgi:hypothetical protein